MSGILFGWNPSPWPHLKSRRMRPDTAPRAKALLTGLAGEGDAVGVVPAAGRRRPDHSPVSGRRRGAGKGRRAGRVADPTDRPPRLRPRPVGAGPALPTVTSAPADHSTAAPAGSLGADWPVGGRAGGRRNRGKPCGRRLPWTLSRLVTRLRETWRVAEVTRGSATQGRGRGDEAMQVWRCWVACSRDTQTEEEPCSESGAHLVGSTSREPKVWETHHQHPLMSPLYPGSLMSTSLLLQNKRGVTAEDS
ncbi:uncharacterized protein LOC102156927 [Canis lupus familiaris]|uniref:uncharacterized protein LOC102156927 n=1 Tax=Canis lupus familiaris TaxID=9615 RepID=UPI0018F28BA5|nr:uncharacterized protein LOC102156927 [Canis lupus familiaris]